MAPQNNTHIVKRKKREPAIAVISVVIINVFNGFARWNR